MRFLRYGASYYLLKSCSGVSHGGGAGFETPLFALALEMDAVCGCGGVYEGEPVPQWVSRLLAGAQALPGALAASLARHATSATVGVDVGGAGEG